MQDPNVYADEAQRLLEEATTPSPRGLMGNAERFNIIARAQVNATLALAAAMELK